MRRGRALAFLVLALLAVALGIFIWKRAAEAPPEAGLPSADASTAPSLTPEPDLPEALFAALDASPVRAGGDEPLRRFPYPYRAMLAICSDCDSTTVETFERTHRFFNTLEMTQYGPGLGLDVSDSFFVYNGSDLGTAENLMSYCEGTNPDITRDAALIKKYYDCGWIDSIHALGDFSSSGGSGFRRDLAQSAWELLDEAAIAPKIWIDHGTYTNVQNFGAYNPNNASSYQAGDDPASPYYHTDITLSRPVRYVWYSRHSDVFGRDFPLEARELRDGRTVWSFQRYTSVMAGSEIDWQWRPNRIHDQITRERLDALADAGQYSIVAQHLNVFYEEEQLGEADIAALRLLSEYCRERKSILVARTSRLLDYAVNRKYLKYQIAGADGFAAIRILSVDDPVFGVRTPEADELAGLTFYIDDGVEALSQVAVFVGNERLDANRLSLNEADETGRRSVSIKWYAEDVRDWTR